MKTLLTLIFALFWATLGHAGIADDAIEARILKGWRANDGTHMAAIELSLAQGWKTYWRAPGDTGIPPQFNWGSGTNMLNVEPFWPVPDKFETAGQPTLGYSDKVVIPLRITPKNGAKQIKLRGRMDIGLCEEVCLPFTVRFNETLPMDGAKDAAIMAALTDQPYSAKEGDVSRAVCSVTPQDDGLTLKVDITLPTTGGDETVVIEHPNKEIWVSYAKSSRSGDTVSAASWLLSPDGSPILIERQKLRFTVIGENYAVDVRGCTGS